MFRTLPNSVRSVFLFGVNWARSWVVPKKVILGI